MSASALYLVAIIVPYLAFAALMATLLVSRPLAALTLAIAAIAAILSVPSRWLLAAWIAAAAAVFVGSGSLLPLLVAACILLLAFSTGARAVRALTLDAGIPTAEFAAFAIVLGLGALSMVTLGLGLLGMLTPWPVLISLLAIAILGYGELRALLSAALQRVRRSPTGRGHAPRAVAILAVLLIVALVEVVAPELQYDALSYHLGLPREYVAAAAIVDRPEQPQSYYYLGMDMDLLLAMFLGGQTAARLLSFAYVLVGAVAMYSCGADLFSRRAGAIAAALYLATPMVGWEATTTYVDGAAATCGLLAAVAAIRARRDQSVRLAVLAGAIAGVGLGVKLTLALAVIPIGLVLVAPRFDRALWRPWRLGLSFVACCALVLAPWPLLRFAQTGNPVFPLLNAVFHSPLWSDVNETFALDRFGNGIPAAIAPIVATYDATPYVEGLIGPVLGLSLLIAPLALRSRNDPVRALLAIGVGTVVLWTLTFEYLRYALPAIPPLTLVAGAYLDAAANRARGIGSRLVRAAPVAVVAAGIVLWLGTYLAVVPDVVPFRVALGLESRAAYLRRGLQTYGPLEFLARTDSGATRVLIASCGAGPDDEDRLYAPGRIEACESPWLRDLYSLHDEAATRAALQARGITHVLVNDAGIRQNMAASALLADGFLTRNARLEYESGTVRLYELEVRP